MTAVTTRLTNTVRPPERIARVLSWLAVCALFLVSTADEAAADPDDDILVVPPGGVTSGTVLNVDLDRTNPTVRSNQRALFSEELTVRDLRDLKVVGNRNVLADNGPIGAAIIGPELTATYRFRDLELGHTTASVAGYDAAGNIERLLTASTAAQRAIIVDRSLDTVLWSYSVTAPTSRPAFRSVIALPSKRVAVGLDWAGTAAPMSAVDIVDLESDAVTRIASRTYAGAPNDLTVQPAIDGLRDLFALGPDAFLFATPNLIGRIDVDGQLAWSVSLSDRDAFGGEFAGIVGLPGDSLAIATRTPGKWLEPGIDHRVHWLDGETREVLATSGILDVAPVDLELAAGHGGSGTLGFEPPIDFVPVDQVGEASISGSVRVDPTPVIVGSPGRVSTDLLNPGDRPAVLRRFQVTATAGDCTAEPPSASQTETWVLTPPRDVAIDPGRSRQFSDAFQTDEPPPNTTWCARMSAVDRDDRRVFFGGSTAFRLVEPGSDAGGPPPQDLGFYNPNDPSNPPQHDIPKGCGCRHADDASGWPGFLVLGALLFGARMRRRLR